MSFNYRFSVIPAGAITDPRLTPRALQVLCLLGRHTNDNGWCSRSQVKMARELDCGRTTIYDAIELLRDAGWVERKANGRGGRPPESAEHPFAAYSYRVVLDRDDLPTRLKEAVVPDDARQAQDQAVTDTAGPGEAPSVDSPPEDPVEGAGQAAGGAGQAAGGAAMPAPLEGISSEGILPEPERESARARDSRARGLAQFEQRWPTAAVDDRGKTSWAWSALDETEREEALAKIGAFLDHLKRHKRTAVPAGWKYLEQKRWKLLDSKSTPSGAPRGFAIAENSEQWRAWVVYHRICGASGIPAFLITGSHGVRSASLPCEWPPVGRGFDAAQTFDVEVIEGTGQYAAWLRRLREIPNAQISARSVMREGRYLGSLRVPCEWPPKRDGTGPPEPASEEELKQFAS